MLYKTLTFFIVPNIFRLGVWALRVGEKQKEVRKSGGVRGLFVSFFIHLLASILVKYIVSFSDQSGSISYAVDFVLVKTCTILR